jgi:hypothetical protein
VVAVVAVEVGVAKVVVVAVVIAVAEVAAVVEVAAVAAVAEVAEVGVGIVTERPESVWKRPIREPSVAALL